jgi:hypothetical protein
VSGRQRVAAAVALLGAMLTIAVAVVEAHHDFPEVLGVLGLIASANVIPRRCCRCGTSGAATAKGASVNNHVC